MVDSGKDKNNEKIVDNNEDFFMKQLEKFKPKPNNEYIERGKTVKEYAYNEDINIVNRNQMEDAHFCIERTIAENNGECIGIFGVLDGHGGKDVVEYCKSRLPDAFMERYQETKSTPMIEYIIDVFKKVDDQVKLIGASEIGCTCCFAVVRNEKDGRVLYVANLGDTRGVLMEDNDAVRVTVDHKASNELEAKRVKDDGGVILRGRVSGQLAVTRAFGDFDLKKEGVICLPDTKRIPLTPKHKFLILASDGLWDIIQDQEAVNLIKDLHSADEMSKRLKEYALKNGSKDNIGVLVVVF